MTEIFVIIDLIMMKAAGMIIYFTYRNMWMEFHTDFIYKNKDLEIKNAKRN